MFKYLVGISTLLFSLAVNAVNWDGNEVKDYTDSKCLKEAKYAYGVMVARQDNLLSIKDMLYGVGLENETEEDKKFHKKLIQQAFKHPKQKSFSSMLNEVELFRAKTYDQCLLDEKENHQSGLIAQKNNNS